MKARNQNFYFVDLRDSFNLKLLEEFINLYNQSFADPSITENPEHWEQRLINDLPIPEPIIHILIVFVRDQILKEYVIGGLVFEYYQESECGLLTYLVIHPQFRRIGLATELVNKSLTILKTNAKIKQKQLNAVFTEVENPSFRLSSAYDIDSVPQLSLMKKLGARMINIPYVQPQLDGGIGRNRKQILLVVFLGVEKQKDYIYRKIVKNFLYEFYKALGVEKPEQDPDMIKMNKHIMIETLFKKID